MAQHALVSLERLADGLVLAPERYDPRRQAGPGDVTVADVATLVRDQISPNGPAVVGRCLVLDTGDARDGFVHSGKTVVAQREIGSTKKRLQPGDAIVSRLRPYLRQVAYVVAGLAGAAAVLLCSAEFYVLRSRDGRSIAFLVPFLLSAPVQRALALSQEGGHHPRFGESDLLGLPLPGEIDKVRDGVSAAVVAAADAARQADWDMRSLVAQFCTGR